MKYIVIVGDPIEGLEFSGPFDSYEEAQTFAEGFIDTWWIAPLQAGVE